MSNNIDEQLEMIVREATTIASAAEVLQRLRKEDEGDPEAIGGKAERDMVRLHESLRQRLESLGLLERWPHP